ncbi:hypothetical protein GQ53DRAFT_353031 [Thozetella sp. PMI_491]|nr:hypothetical protein GQ53DRAFT_353031 [Thozetella sp. PMI_491]
MIMTGEVSWHAKIKSTPHLGPEIKNKQKSGLLALPNEIRQCIFSLAIQNGDWEGLLLASKKVREDVLHQSFRPAKACYIHRVLPLRREALGNLLKEDEISEKDVPQIVRRYMSRMLLRTRSRSFAARILELKFLLDPDCVDGDWLSVMAKYEAFEAGEFRLKTCSWSIRNLSEPWARQLWEHCIVDEVIVELQGLSQGYHLVALLIIWLSPSPRASFCNFR